MLESVAQEDQLNQSPRSNSLRPSIVQVGPQAGSGVQGHPGLQETDVKNQINEGRPGFRHILKIGGGESSEAS